ncbi:hypothetical protein PtA15_18A222 [Puccinia triticina]|uniref:Uncharacterized protein n=1 Tax=Puccinia triticina TaxID=208348 RepID=A0ABY7D682_9BASI|nr:uncharacterized protein PtA15_18A222 [Puccinia triticina]WAQ93164.1 hypothetical protein PtA15_18A222 [Puccinia triticina]WAR63142.1 hypothetical protein PtB15_18B224 [Puccinia triticina]
MASFKSLGRGPGQSEKLHHSNNVVQAHARRSKAEGKADKSWKRTAKFNRMSGGLVHENNSDCKGTSTWDSEPAVDKAEGPSQKDGCSMFWSTLVYHH